MVELNPDLIHSSEVQKGKGDMWQVRPGHSRRETTAKYGSRKVLSW